MSINLDDVIKDIYKLDDAQKTKAFQPVWDIGVFNNEWFNNAFNNACGKYVNKYNTPQKPKSMHDVNAATKAATSHVKKINRDSKFGMGQIQEKDFLRGVQWMMQVYFEKNSILVWKKFSEAEPPKGTTILSRYLKDHAYDYSLMKYGDNDFKRSVLMSVDAEWSTVEATDHWYSMGADPFANDDARTVSVVMQINNIGILPQISKMP